MSRTKQEIEILLSEKFRRESARLKSWGTKTDEKAAMSFAMAVSEFVRALMCDSRYRELKRVLKKVPDDHYAGNRGLKRYIQERLKATKAMAKAIGHSAIVGEGKRQWQYTSKRKHKHRSKHGHS